MYDMQFTSLEISKLTQKIMRKHDKISDTGKRITEQTADDGDNDAEAPNQTKFEKCNISNEQ